MVIAHFVYHPYSHLTEKSIRRRYGRSSVNVRAFVRMYNRHGHRGNLRIHNNNLRSI